MIAKPQVFAKLEVRYRDPGLRRESLRRLKEASSAEDLIAAGRAHRTAHGKHEGDVILEDAATSPSFSGRVDEGAHVLEDWFGSGWGWTAPNRAEIVRRALIETIETIDRLEKHGRHPVPVQLLWICMGNPAKFEASVFWTDDQVTTIFLTGPVPMPRGENAEQSPLDERRKHPGSLIVRNAAAGDVEVVGPTRPVTPMDVEAETAAPARR